MKKFQVCFAGFSGPIDQRFPLDSLELCALVAGKASWKIVNITVVRVTICHRTDNDQRVVT